MSSATCVTFRLSRACTTSQYWLMARRIESLTEVSKFARVCLRLRCAIMMGARLAKKPRLRKRFWVRETVSAELMLGFKVAKLLLVALRFAFQLTLYCVPLWNNCE